MKTAIVIGAGPAGLTAAYSLLENGGAWRVVVLEASGEIGGLARTVAHGACRIDIGGHRFFSKNAEVNALWAKLMPTQGAPAWDDRALATLWPAAVYRESPLALILQIPEIGKPYLHVTAGTIPNAICALAGEGGVLAWGALCVLACAALSFLTRSAPCWLLRCVPALIVFPVWTYSQPHDLAIQLPLYALLLLAVFGKAPFPIPRWGRRLACVAVWAALFGRVFERAWQLANETRFVNLAGYDWLYIVVVHLALALASLACLALAFFARPTPNPPHSSP